VNDSKFLPVPDHVDPPRVRYHRFAHRSVAMMDATGVMGLPEWCDLLDFHRAGERQAQRLLLAYDHQGVRQNMAEAGLSRSPLEVGNDRRARNRALFTLMDFVDRMQPADRALFYVHVTSLEHNGGTVSLYQENGRRVSVPYAPGALRGAA
jgi:hypothetical protein